MDFLEQVADDLAKDVLKVVDALDDEEIIMQINKTITASSATLGEAYMTAVRVRRAEGRARQSLKQIAESRLAK